MNIAISGKMCSGKTTLANQFVRHKGYVLASYAKPMKTLFHCLQAPLCERVALLYGYCIAGWGEDLGYDIAAWIVHTFLTPGEPFICDGKDDVGRKILQELGNGIREKFGGDIWVKGMEKEIQRYDDSIVIDDVRYPNELKWCKDNGFFTVRLEVPEEERRKRIKDLYGSVSEDRINHVSETLLDSATFDYVHHWQGESPEEIKEILEGMIYEFVNTKTDI